MPEEKNEKLISVREAAKECGRNMETVRRWIWAGKLPAQKLGNQLFIKRSDLASYCRLPTRSVPAKAGETARLPQTPVVGEQAVKYRGETEMDFLEKAITLRNRIKAREVEPIDAAEDIRQMREEHMNEIELRLPEPETGTKPGSRANLIKRMRKLREEIRARTGKVFDAETMIRELRDERDRETR
ncbi:MAG: helix-turn-helix domain-containing protein [Chloroflexi bacterium]|nr:helix-turn-helix domain-containing protein [Chloroflexota bacterium]